MWINNILRVDLRFVCFSVKFSTIFSSRVFEICFPGFRARILNFLPLLLQVSYHCFSYPWKWSSSSFFIVLVIFASIFFYTPGLGGHLFRSSTPWGLLILTHSLFKKLISWVRNCFWNTLERFLASHTTPSRQAKVTTLSLFLSSPNFLLFIFVELNYSSHLSHLSKTKHLCFFSSYFLSEGCQEGWKIVGAGGKERGKRTVLNVIFAWVVLFL